jgi:dTDP-4-amino-4,6-dideoxygalactose transaminase
MVQVQPEYGRSRDELAAELAGLGIGTSVHFIPLHHMTYLREHSLVPPGGLPGADAAFDRLLSLPMYPDLSDAAVDRVCDALARLARPLRRPVGRTA